MANPTGPSAAPVTRTVRAVVPVIKPLATPIGQNNPLNFIYGNAINFQQSVTVASPVYAVGDLQLQNSSTISEWIGNSPGSPNKVAVGGNFWERTDGPNGNKAGHVNGTADPANLLGEMYIAGQCRTKNNHTVPPIAPSHARGDRPTRSGLTTHGNTIPSTS